MDAHPIAFHQEHFHPRAMRELAQDAAGRARLCAQIQAAGRIGKANHRINPCGFYRRLRRFRAILLRCTPGKVARGIGEFQRAHLNARKIKGQNVAIRHAIFRGHLLRAALAHAHAVPKTAGREREAARRFRNLVSFVVRGIDAQPQRALQQAIRGQIKRHAAGRRRPRPRSDGDPHLGIRAAGRGIIRGMQLHAIQRFYYNTAAIGWQPILCEFRRHRV